MPLAARSVRVGVGRECGQGEAALEDAFGGDEAVGDGLDFLARATQDDDFEAVVVVEVDVEGGDDGVVVLVLGLSQFFGEKPDMVVVDHGQRADDGLGGGFDLRLIQFGPDEVADSLAAVGIAALGDEIVKGFQEIGINRYTDAA